MLTVLDIIHKEGSPLMAYCKCDCGGFITTQTTLLRAGNVKSCGCLSPSRSYATIYIEKFLKSNNIPFKKEYKFSDLRSDKNKPLRFDFAIFKNNKIEFLIEYQGGQHFTPCDLFGGIEGFKKLQIHDKRKVEYCKNNNIKLLIYDYKQHNKDICKDILREYN